MSLTRGIGIAAATLLVTSMAIASPRFFAAAESPVFVPMSNVNRTVGEPQSRSIGVPAELQWQLESHGYKQIGEERIFSRSGDIQWVNTTWESPDMPMLLIAIYPDRYVVERAGYFADGKWLRWCNVPNNPSVARTYRVQAAVNVGRFAVSAVFEPLPYGDAVAVAAGEVLMVDSYGAAFQQRVSCFESRA